jgi:hypothetical protein
MFPLDATRQWVENWKRLGPLLKTIEHEELRAFRFEDHWELVDGLLQFAFDASQTEDRQSSGLVEQQRWFAKARP